MAAVDQGTVEAHTPVLVFSEVANALLGYVRAGALTVEDGVSALDALGILPLQLHGPELARLRFARPSSWASPPTTARMPRSPTRSARLSSRPIAGSQRRSRGPSCLTDGLRPAVWSDRGVELAEAVSGWQASRKEFLAPENWLEPELRDKTPVFPRADVASRPRAGSRGSRRPRSGVESQEALLVAIGAPRCEQPGSTCPMHSTRPSTGSTTGSPRGSRLGPRPLQRAGSAAVSFERAADARAR